MAEYFSHDYNARNDPKLVKLQMEMGYEGIGIYWSFVEYLYEQKGEVKISDCKSIAFALHVDIELLERVIDNYDLFSISADTIFSMCIKKRLLCREKVSDKRRRAAKQMHKNRLKYQQQSIDANAEQMHSTCNAIKESKEKKVKERKKDVNDTTLRRAHATDIIEPRKEALPAPCPPETDFSSSPEGTATAELKELRGFELLTHFDIERIKKLPPGDQISAAEGMISTKRKRSPSIIKGVV